jgi:hypothetical protein
LLTSPEYADPYLVVLVNNQQGGFTQTLITNPAGPQGVILADLNLDGNLDAIVWPCCGPSVAYVYIGAPVAGSPPGSSRRAAGYSPVLRLTADEVSLPLFPCPQKFTFWDTTLLPRGTFFGSGPPVRSRTPQGRFPPARLLHPGGRYCETRLLRAGPSIQLGKRFLRGGKLKRKVKAALHVFGYQFPGFSGWQVACDLGGGR